MKKVISENDYERYRIQIPVQFFMNGKQRKYISSQLEKMHPCFSDSFCFDSKYRLSKKGVVANVTVMDKLRLGEYKATYPGAVLACKEKGGGCVFVDRKTKAILTALFCVPLLGCLFAGMNGIGGKHGKNAGQTSVAVEAVSESIDGLSRQNENSAFAYERLFDSLEKESGKIESLTWKYDGFTENLSVGVKNCYPDAFLECGFDGAKAVKALFSNINYVNDVPSFSMSVSNKRIADFGSRDAGFEKSVDGVLGSRDARFEKSAGGNFGSLASFSVENQVENQSDFLSGDFRANVREVLKENGVKIAGENYQPYKIRFQISAKNIEGGVLESIEGIANKAGWCVNEVSLNVAAKNAVDMEISFTDDFCYSAEKSILSSIKYGLKNIANLSVESIEDGVADGGKNQPDKSIKSTKKSDSSGKSNQSESGAGQGGIRVVVMTGKNHPSSGDRKIGTITHANGEKVVYYKTAKGAIRNE